MNPSRRVVHLLHTLLNGKQVPFLRQLSACQAASELHPIHQTFAYVSCSLGREGLLRGVTSFANGGKLNTSLTPTASSSIGYLQRGQVTSVSLRTFQSAVGQQSTLPVNGTQVQSQTKTEASGIPENDTGWIGLEDTEVTDDLESEPDWADQRQQLLEAALQHVAARGWSHAALQAGARDLALSPAAAGALGADGSALVQYFVGKCNSEVQQQLLAGQPELRVLPLQQRITTAVKLRLAPILPLAGTWAQAMSLQAQPRNLAVSLNQLTDLVDILWHAVGDESTDINWYTKRALLAGVYTATELYLLTDYSPQFQDTWHSLERRVKDMLWAQSGLTGHN